MAESNSQATRCPCGFFGSAQTLGLCSKCYNEREQNRAALLAVDAARSSPDRRLVDLQSSSFQTDPESQHNDDNCTSSSTAPLHCSQAMSSSSDVGTSSDETNINPTAEHNGPDDPAMRLNITPVAHTTNEDWNNSLCSSTDASSSTQHTRKRKIDCADSHIPAAEETTYKEQEDSCEERVAGCEEREVSSVERGEETCEEPERKVIVVLPVQKNMKRCFICKCRLPPAAILIGRCKCECVFCALHRLPEQHTCAYDHKGQGRAEARTKMIVLRKHVGTSLKRLDAEDV